MFYFCFDTVVLLQCLNYTIQRYCSILLQKPGLAANMDSQLSDFKTIANECLSKLNNGFNLTEVDESESMLFFSNGSVTFSVGCSATRDGNKWV